MKKLLLAMTLAVSAANATTLLWIYGTVEEVVGVNTENYSVGDQWGFYMTGPDWNGIMGTAYSHEFVFDHQGYGIEGTIGKDAYADEMTLSYWEDGEVIGFSFTAVDIDVQLKQWTGFNRFWQGQPGTNTRVYGTIDSFEYMTDTPEPSTLLLSAPVLLGLWGYRRVLSRRRSRTNL